MDDQAASDLPVPIRLRIQLVLIRWRETSSRERFDYDGGRQVTVYVPPGPPEAVVFAGDGQLIPQWGRHLEAAEVPPTMIVGAHHTDDDDEMARIREYSPSFDAERFEAHETFFVHEVRSWVRSRFGVALPAERTAVYGVSASGELALAMGLRHPDDLRRGLLRIAGRWLSSASM